MGLGRGGLERFFVAPFFHTLRLRPVAGAGAEAGGRSQKRSSLHRLCSKTQRSASSLHQSAAFCIASPSERAPRSPPHRDKRTPQKKIPGAPSSGPRRFPPRSQAHPSQVTPLPGRRPPRSCPIAVEHPTGTGPMYTTERGRATSISEPVPCVRHPCAGRQARLNSTPYRPRRPHQTPS